MIERRGILQFNDRDVSIVGMDLAIGIDAPIFTAVDQDWHEISALETTAGKIRILLSLPSLETSVCDREARRFNKEAAGLSSEIVLIAISADLPFTQARWCAAEGVERMMVLSDHKYADFGHKYACLLNEPRILRRAVFIVDREDKLRYVSYMPELATEPDYGDVLRSAKALLEE